MSFRQVVEGGAGGSSDSLGGEVELSIIGITVRLSKWAHVEDEEKGTQHWTLIHAMGDRNYGRFAVELMSVGEVRLEPWKGSASNTKGGFEVCDECGMVNGVEGNVGVKEDEDVDETRIWA